MDKCNLFLSTNVLLFGILRILIHHFVLFSLFLVKKTNFMSKGKPILRQAAYFFSVFYLGWTYILKDSLYIKVISQ